jgi:hypothetical protein
VKRRAKRKAKPAERPAAIPRRVRNGARANGAASPSARAPDLIELVRSMLQADIKRAESGIGYDGKRLSVTQHRLVRSQCVGNLYKIGKLTGETLEIAESRLVKMPAWRSLRSRVLAALAPYPEAMAAVIAALKDAGEP